MNELSVWRCEGCCHEIPAKQIKGGNAALQSEIANLNRNPKEFERFLVKYAETLHPFNSHVVQIKYALTQLYGNVRGFMLVGKFSCEIPISLFQHHCFTVEIEVSFNFSYFPFP